MMAYSESKLIRIIRDPATPGSERFRAVMTLGSIQNRRHRLSTGRPSEYDRESPRLGQLITVEV